MPNSTRGKSAAKSRSAEGVIPKTIPRARKPAFPLWLHEATGQWCKKIRGRKYYFGTDKDAALKEYLRVKDDREAGREPPPPDDRGTTIKLLVNTFLTHKMHQVALGELTQTSFNDYRDSGEKMAEFFGKTKLVESLRPDDLLRYRHHLGKGDKSPHTVGGEVNRCRVILRFAFEAGLVNVPIRFGEFKRPKKSAFRRQRQSAGSRMFEAADILRLLEAADSQMKAMILLGLNCGFGNADCGTLPLSAVDLKASWIDYPRPKTGIERRCPLWPETTQAIKEWLVQRKPPKEESNSHLLFVTKYGQPWHRDGAPGSPLSAEFRKLLNRLDLYRPGLSFYSLRHCFQTIADEVGDYIATRRIMGHADNSISDHYRERFQDERLRKVVDHVHDWLFGQSENTAADE